MLEWLRKIPGGDSGAWFEFYGNRPVPPCPQVGIIPWTWAELIIFFVHHLMGLRPMGDHLWIRPRLLEGLERAEIEAPVGHHRIHLTVERGDRDDEGGFYVNDRYVGEKSTGLRLEVPQADLAIRLVQLS